jgi:hypothetical protein
MAELPQTYRVQDGCHNCKHVFIYYEHDCGETGYCTLNAPPRPPCRSVAMDECPSDPSIPESDWNGQFESNCKAHQAWMDWAMHRMVSDSGICDSHAPAAEISPPAEEKRK